MAHTMDRQSTTDTRSIAALTVLLACALHVQAARAAELYNDQLLYAEPSVKAAHVGTARYGSVEVLERQGFWVNIQAAGISGWTMLSNVGMEETTTWMNPPVDVLRDTGRLGKDAEQAAGKTE